MRRVSQRCYRGKYERFCLRERADPMDLGELEWNPAADRSEGLEVWRLFLLGTRRGGHIAPLVRGGGVSELSAGPPGSAVDGNSNSGVSPPSSSVQVHPSSSLLVQVHPSSSFSVQAPSFPSSLVAVPPEGPSFDENCT